MSALAIMDRRDFIKLTAITGTSATLAGCGNPEHRLIRFVPDRPGHDRRYAIDCAKIEQELGWRPKYTLEEGLRETIAWYQEHGDWIAAV